MSKRTHSEYLVDQPPSSHHHDTQPILNDVDPNSVIPESLRTLRACLSCSMVKSFSQFVFYGCENCTFLEMEKDKKTAELATSTSFEGLIAYLDRPDSRAPKSWVAKWQGIQKFKRGMYAIKVYGVLPAELEDKARAAYFGDSDEED